MSKWQKGCKIGTNGKRNAVALTEKDKRRVNGLRELITNTLNLLAHHATRQPQPLLRAWWLQPAHHHLYVLDGILLFSQQYGHVRSPVRHCRLLDPEGGWPGGRLVPVRGAAYDLLALEV